MSEIQEGKNDFHHVKNDLDESLEKEKNIQDAKQKLEGCKKLLKAVTECETDQTDDDHDANCLALIVDILEDPLTPTERVVYVTTALLVSLWSPRDF